MDREISMLLDNDTFNKFASAQHYSGFEISQYVIVAETFKGFNKRKTVHELQMFLYQQGKCLLVTNHHL